MAAKIRLKKVGRRGQPAYRVVVLDGRKPRDAKVVADLGHYDPKTNPATFEIDGDAALKWLLDGAKATKAARDILSLAGVMAAWDAARRGETIEIEAKELKPTTKSKKVAEEKPEPETTEVEAAGAAEEGSEAEAPTSAEETADETSDEATSELETAEAEPEEETEDEEVEDEDSEDDEEEKA